VKNQSNFHLQKLVWDFEPSIKSYGQISKMGWKGRFLLHFQTSSLDFVHKFLFGDLKTHSGLKRWKFSWFFTLTQFKTFWKSIVLCLNEVWNSTLKTILAFDLIMSSWAHNVHIPYGLFYLLLPFLFKNLSSLLYIHKIREFWSCMR